MVSKEITKFLEFSDRNLYHLNTNLQVVGDTTEVINYLSLMDISDDGIVFMENRGSVFHIFRAGERKPCWVYVG